MNPSEQKNHSSRLNDLASGLDVFQSATVDAISELRTSIGAERTARLELAREQRSYVDGSDRELRRIGDERWTATGEAQMRIIAMSDPLRRPFWGRLKWLMVGR